MAPCDAWLSHLGSLWGHLRSLGGHLGALGTATGGHLGSLGATCESLWSHFGVTWASNWPQDCITVTISQTYVKHTKSLRDTMIFAVNMPKIGSLRVTLGSLRVTLGSLEVTWGHLGSLDGIGCPMWCHFGVTCARLEGTWGHLGRPLGVTWSLGATCESLWSHFRATWASN